MIPQLSQETVTEYANDAQTIQQPYGADYSQGVRVGKTIPAKWWNWLFNAVTKRVSQSKADAQDMLDELKNVVTDAGITPSASDGTQLARGVAVKADRQIDRYVEKIKQQFCVIWDKVGLTGTGDASPYMHSQVVIIGNYLVADDNEGHLRYSSDGYNYSRFPNMPASIFTAVAVNSYPIYVNGKYIYIHGYADEKDIGPSSIGVFARRARIEVFVGTEIYNMASIGGVEDVYTTTSEKLRYSGACFVIGTDVYIQSAFEGKIYKLNTINNAITDTGYSGLDDKLFNTDPYGSFGRSFYFPEIVPVVSGQKYYIGGVEFSNGVFTKLNNALGISNVAPKKLRNGNIAFTSTEWYRNAQKYVHNQSSALLADGVVTLKNYAANKLQGCDDCVIIIDASVNKTWVSYDGINLIYIPFYFPLTQIYYNGADRRIIQQVDDMYFLYPTNSTGTQGQYIQRIQTTLSDTRSDYTQLSIYAPERSESYTVYGRLAQGICVFYPYHTSGLYVSFDYGNTLTRMTYADGANVYYVSKLIEYKGKYIGNASTWTSHHVNRVSGHTLYLR